MKGFNRGIKKLEKSRKSYCYKLGGVFAKNAKLAVGLMKIHKPKIPQGLLEKLGSKNFDAERATVSVNGTTRGTNKSGNMKGLGSLFVKNGINNIKYRAYNRRKKGKKFAKDNKSPYADYFVMKKYGDYISPARSRIQSDFSHGIDIMLDEIKKEIE